MGEKEHLGTGCGTNRSLLVRLAHRLFHDARALQRKTTQLIGNHISELTTDFKLRTQFMKPAATIGSLGRDYNFVEVWGIGQFRTAILHVNIIDWYSLSY